MPEKPSEVLSRLVRFPAEYCLHTPDMRDSTREPFRESWYRLTLRLLLLLPGELIYHIQDYFRDIQDNTCSDNTEGLRCF